MSIYNYVKEKYDDYSNHINKTVDLWTSYLLPVTKVACELANDRPDVDVTVVEYAALLHNVALAESFFSNDNMRLQGEHEMCAERAAQIIGHDLPEKTVEQIVNCIRYYGKEATELNAECSCLTDAIAVISFEKMYELLHWRKQLNEKYTDAIKSEIEQLTESYLLMSSSVKEGYKTQFEDYISILNAKLHAINDDALGSIISGYTGIVMQDGGCN